MPENLITKSIQVLKNDGLYSLVQRSKHYLKVKQEGKRRSDAYKDILFINGCAYDLLPHPPRYRVKHQMEQLELNGYTCDEIYYKNIDLNQVRMYRLFIIFRAPCTNELKEFIQKARSWNKKVLFDIDDLVIDTKYTNQLDYVHTMSQNKKKQYDKDVMAMKETLLLCDGAITTTKALANELKNYVQSVFINRNKASLEMLAKSQEVRKESSNKIKIGYFSGSASHKEDFKMIQGILLEILKENQNVELHVVGHLDLDKKIQSQVITHPFMDYKKLFTLLGQMDINLAPLTNNLFNKAKSEIKWMESSLVKVCTIASNLGAFQESIKHDVTGILCQDLSDWKAELTRLIKSKELRDTLAQNAYQECMNNHTTIYSHPNFIQCIQQTMSPNLVFGVSKLEMSGGMQIILRHASILQKAGYDVSLLSYYDTKKEAHYAGSTFPILPLHNEKLNLHIDTAVATMWPTVAMLEDVRCINKRKYLVQGFETNFYNFNDPLKIRANQSYRPKSRFEFLTISKWCQAWLKEKFDKAATYIPNGIDIKQFKSRKRNLGSKIRILIEGDCSRVNKNIDESFKIANKLDPNQFEIWYMAYHSKPKDWYRIDKFFSKVDYEKVGDIYYQCDILIKSSLLESFSLPPLEMMATGGYVLAIKNEGNQEYLIDRKNCLFYEEKNIKQAIRKINELINDQNLQEILYQNGMDTAKQRDWKYIEDSIIESYR